MNTLIELKQETLEKVLEKLFNTQRLIQEKDFKISMLEFELELEKRLLETLRKYYLHN